MSLEITSIPVLRDNYAWLLKDTRTGMVAVVDPGEAEPVAAALDNGRLDLILLTHHHADHIGGAEALRAQSGAAIAGPGSEAHRLPRLDIALEDGDRIALGDESGTVIGTPGHADGHISFYFPSKPALFCGDTLFSMGCGRLLEGSAEELFASLARFGSLPDETLIFCGHEYTLTNGAFALGLAPNDAALRQRVESVQRLRAQGKPTVPVTLGVERQTNPFLRARDCAQFAALRKARDVF